MKKCNKCKELLEYSKFAKNRSHRDGYENYCKACKNQYNKRYGDTYTKAYLKKGGYGIYKITNNITGEFYIGKGWLNERKVDHFTKLKAQKHSNPYLQYSYNNVSHDDLEFSILEKCDSKLGSEKERHYIIEAYLKDAKNLLNQHVTLRWQTQD
jgi:hypothetical protein